MAEPFEPRAPEQEGLLSRVAGRVTRVGAARELETILAEAQCVRDVALEKIQALGERHGIDLAFQLRTLRCNLYRRFLEHCLLDFSLSESEVADIEHLRTLLHLQDGDVARIQDQVSRQVYGAAVHEVLEDHRLDEEEVQFLKRLRENLDLAEYHAERIVEEERRRSQQRLLSRTAIHSSFLAPEGCVIDLAGVSREGVQAAIQTAIDEASQALPSLAWAELGELRVQIESGRVVKWAVKLRAGVQPDEGPAPNE